MIRYLLDSNIVSEPAKKHPDAQVMRRFQLHQQEMAITSVVWHELVYGLERLPRGRKRAYLEAYLTQVVRSVLPILPYEEAAASWHGRERARLEKLGKTRSFADGMVAAVAATQGLIVATRNTDDFAGFSALVVENWFDE